MERTVGWFVFLATALLLVGFGYYLYHAAERKGWFLVNAEFYSYLDKATGLKVGDPVMLMGFEVGRVTDIAAMPPRTPHNVRIGFVVNQINRSQAAPVPYYSYIWSQGSEVKLTSDFLGKRGIEISRGTNGYGIYTTFSPKTLKLAEARDLPHPQEWRLAENIFDEDSNLVVRAWTSLTNLAEIARWRPESILAFHISARREGILAVWNERLQGYVDFAGTNTYELPVDETPAVSDQLQAMVAQIKQALPSVLTLTNQLAAVLNHASEATSNLNVTIAAAHPLVTNFAALSGEIRGPGALGTWVLGSQSSVQLQTALTNANTLLANVDSNLNTLSDEFGLTLEHLADITSNLNTQVAANSNMLSGISKTVTDSDTFIQGLKRHWLLRSAFKTKHTNQPASK